MKPLFLALPIAFSLSLAPGFLAPAAAQNLTVNPGFDTGLSGWQAGAGTTWDGTRDAGGSASSGSAKASWSPGGDVVVVTQCVPIPQPGTLSVLSSQVFIPSGQTIGDGVFITAGYFPDPGCTGIPFPDPPVGRTPLVTATGRWTPAATVLAPFGRSALIGAVLRLTSAAAFTANVDDFRLEPATSATCLEDLTTLCLHALRFKVTATYDAGNGNAGTARVQDLTGDSGFLWFFNNYNVEAIVKVFDGCGLGGHYWFFAAGLTNVKVTITVTDLQTGAVKTYTNPLGKAFAPIADTSAFACP
jgi:hypothetical protein